MQSNLVFTVVDNHLSRHTSSGSDASLPIQDRCTPTASFGVQGAWSCSGTCMRMALHAGLINAFVCVAEIAIPLCACQVQLSTYGNHIGDNMNDLFTFIETRLKGENARMR